MANPLTEVLKRENQNLKDAGLFKFELPLESPQKPIIHAGDRELINLASSNYLGFANDPSIKKAAKLALDRFGVGLSAPRTHTGSQTQHRELEQKLADFSGAEDAMLFASGYHANTGIFEPLFGNRDFIFLDARAHPSLADGIRLAGAKVRPYRHLDLEDLEDRLKRSRAARFRVIVTDGVYPIDGTLAPLDGICHLATRYDAMVIVSDAQGIGVLGERGRGVGEHFRVAPQLTL
ncbi:MAG: aminotransferase class I/II-fold pyridoxal phosphate-dependent enzyme, partial [Myxococcota bacterium]